jgi:hypothetical protein
MSKRPIEDLEDGELDEAVDFISDPISELSNCIEEPDGEELMQYAILPIERMKGEVPMTGEEYLFMVREERNRLPKVVTANLKSTAKKNISELLPNHEEASWLSRFAPEEQWQQQVIQAFVTDRETWSSQLDTENFECITEIPAINDEIAWSHYLYGSESKMEPSFQIFSELGHIAKMRLILYHHRWLEASGTLSVNQYKWIYCLLVNTPDGLSAEEMSIIRALTRSCIKLRHREADPTKEIDWDILSNLDAIITVVGKYFSQTDLLH